MGRGKSLDRLSRREFLKLGAISATALCTGSMMAEVLNAQGTSAKPFDVPVYRTLGRTGLKVTVVSVGAMLTPEHEVIRASLDMGMNYVDTARVYMGGRNEEIVGRAIKGIRDKIYLATKTRHNTRKEIFDDIEASLSKLKTDHVDVLQLHNLTSKDRAYIPEVRQALLDLRKQGKVRFFGFTTHTNPAEVVKGVAEDPEKFFDVALVAYNFKSGPEVKEAIATAAKTGMGVVAMKTQAGGYKAGALGGISPHQAALKWALSDPNIACAIPGMKDMDMVREDGSVMGMKLTAADERILQRYGRAIEPYYCRLCGQCESTCPLSVAISDINRCLMYAEGYGELALARSTYREIPRSLSARACTGCSTCTARCAYGLDIARKMERARSLLG